MKTLSIIKLWTVLTLLSSSALSAQIITNGDFSSFGTIDSFGYSTTITDWTSSNSSTGLGGNGVGQPAGGTFNPDGYGGGPADPSIFAFVQNTASLTQDITLAPDEQYTLNFEVGQRALTGVPLGSVVVTAGGSAISTTLLNPTPQFFFFVTPVTFTTGADASSATIALNGFFTGSDATLEFANVSITDDGPAAVPEPSTWAMLSLGVASLFFIRKLRGLLALDR
jgi:hypothetical protein